MQDSNTRTEQTDGDVLEAEAEDIVETFNDAASDYSPDLEWFGMSVDVTGEQSFVFEATDYICSDGLAALREDGRVINYIEVYEYGNEYMVQIQIPVESEE